jgi:hypothetical protein
MSFVRSAVVAALFASVAGAQQPAIPSMPPQTAESRRGVGDTSIFAPLNLAPQPNMYRGADGRPGPKYWQQRADYDLRATLDTATKTVSGSMTLRYTNNSPDTLTFLWFQTEQNAFRPGSLNTLVFEPGSRFGSRNFAGGDVFDHFNEVVNGKAVALKLRDNGTVTKVDRSHRGRPRRSTSRGTSSSRSTARTAWGATDRSTRSRSGIRVSTCTTTSAGGTRSRTSDRESSTSSTATSR